MKNEMEKIFTELEKISRKMVDKEVDHITICTDGEMIFTSGMGSPELLGEALTDFIITHQAGDFRLLKFLKDLVYEIEYNKRLREGDEEENEGFSMN